MGVLFWGSGFSFLFFLFCRLCTSYTVIHFCFEGVEAEIGFP